MRYISVYSPPTVLRPIKAKRPSPRSGLFYQHIIRSTYWLYCSPPWYVSVNTCSLSTKRCARMPEITLPDIFSNRVRQDRAQATISKKRERSDVRSDPLSYTFFPIFYFQGSSTTLTQSSSFSLKILYACATCESGRRCVMMSSNFTFPSTTYCNSKSMCLCAGA